MKKPCKLTILLIIATALQLLPTIAFFVLYNNNPLPANIAEVRRRQVTTENKNGKVTKS